MIPVDRSGGQSALTALNQGRQVLEDGHLFGIYPEGTRSPDGRLYRGKTGVARLALETGAPVIPVAMIGTNLAQPPGRRLPRPTGIGIVFGAPLDFSRYAGRDRDREVLREVTDEIMYQLMLLSGQEYVDVYAATMKARITAGTPEDLDQDQEAAPGGRTRPKGLQAPQPEQES
jgi:1-acyl-sn-glycerol-3-phosphate acyltransferase